MYHAHYDARIPPDTQPLYHYTQFEWFKDMLGNSCLYLNSVAKFADKTEAIMTAPTTAQLREEEPDRLAIEKYFLLHKATRPFGFAHCWCAHSTELAPMWKLFSPSERRNVISKHGIAIRSSFGALRDSLDKEDDRLIRISLMKYLDRHSELSNFDNMLATFFEKDISLIDERELRVLFYDIEAFQKSAQIPTCQDAQYRRISINPITLVEAVIPSPTAGSTEIDQLRSLLLKFGIENRLEHSRLIESATY
jgi:hypothetical protein